MILQLFHFRVDDAIVNLYYLIGFGEILVSEYSFYMKLNNETNSLYVGYMNKSVLMICVCVCS